MKLMFSNRFPKSKVQIVCIDSTAFQDPIFFLPIVLLVMDKDEKESQRGLGAAGMHSSVNEDKDLTALFVLSTMMPNGCQETEKLPKAIFLYQ